MYLIILLTVLVLSLLVLCLYSKWLTMQTYWTQKGVTQVPLHPVFGSLTFLQRKNPHIWLKEIYNEYKAPYLGAWLFWQPCLIVNCPELARRVLVKDNEVFRNRYLSSGKTDPIGALNLFTANDNIWSSVRRRLTAVFTSSKLRGHKTLYRDKNQDLIYRINLENKKGNNVSLRSLFADYTTDIIGESAFGIKCEATRYSTGPLREMTKDLEKFSTWRGMAWSSIFFFPQLVDIFGFSFWPKHTVKYFRNVYTTMLGKRGGYLKETDGKRDLLDTLIKLKRDAIKENRELDENVVLANAMVFLQGGYDTSSGTITYTIYELAHSPECQEILYEELKHSNLDEENLAELPYLNSVVKEALRKYPTMGWLDRVALQDYEINENLSIPAGTVVYVNAVGMQNDPLYYPDPEVFKPERWLPENAANITPYTYIPFGEGPRSCIGKRFGQNTVRNAVASVIMNFEVKPLPNTPKPNDVLVEKKGLFFSPGEKISVEFKPRNLEC